MYFIANECISYHCIVCDMQYCLHKLSIYFYVVIIIFFCYFSAGAV